SPPAQPLFSHRVKTLLKVGGGLLTLVIIGVGIWLYRLDESISQRFAEKRFAPPVEFYSAPEEIKPGMRLPEDYVAKVLKERHFRQRQFGQPLQAGDVSAWTAEQCRSLVRDLSETATQCLGFRSPPDGPVQIAAFDAVGKITNTYSGIDPQPAPS